MPVERTDRPPALSFACVPAAADNGVRLHEIDAQSTPSYRPAGDVACLVTANRQWIVDRRTMSSQNSRRSHLERSLSLVFIVN